MRSDVNRHLHRCFRGLNLDFGWPTLGQSETFSEATLELFGVFALDHSYNSRLTSVSVLMRSKLGFLHAFILFTVRIYFTAPAATHLACCFPSYMHTWHIWNMHKHEPKSIFWPEVVHLRFAQVSTMIVYWTWSTSKMQMACAMSVPLLCTQTCSTTADVAGLLICGSRFPLCVDMVLDTAQYHQVKLTLSVHTDQQQTA